MSALHVYSIRLRAWVSLQLLDAEEATYKERGGVSYAFGGTGEKRFVRHAVFTGVREGGTAFLICAGLQGAICTLLPDGRAQWSWSYERTDEAQPSKPFEGEIAHRETLKPTGTN